MSPEALAALHARAFAPAQGWTAKDFADLLARPEVHLFTGQDAFLLARIIPPEAEILTLATDPARRRQGQASALLSALDAAPGAKVTFLEVAADNAAALALYAARGFAAAGRRAGYYPRPGGAVDAVLMRKALTRGQPA